MSTRFHQRALEEVSESVKMEKEADTAFKAEYAALLRLVQEAEALEAGEADFLRDAGGADEVGRSQFLDAIFELADIYVSSAVAEDYAAFLLALSLLLLRFLLGCDNIIS